jgi:hypothetical protein
MYFENKKLIFDYEDPQHLILYSIAFILFSIFLYFTIHFGKMMGTVMFFLTKLSFLVICLIAAIIAICLIVPAMQALWMYLMLLARFFIILTEWFKKLPERIKWEVKIWRQIWSNRGFGKYKLFGGISFYLKLRLRILAFFCFGMSFLLLSYGFYFNYKQYHRQYWIEKVFYGQAPLKIYTFLPNIPYTIKTKLMIYYFKFENSKQMVYFPIDENLYKNYQIPIPHEWNITFGDTTQVSMGTCFFTSPAISELFDTYDLEIWENLRGGETLDTNYIRQFTPPHVYQKNIRLAFPPGHWDD